MGKEKFTAPFWALLIVGIVALGGYALMIRIVLGSMFYTWGLKILLYYPWPILAFIESIVYWRISKRNVDRKDSWAHVILFSSAAALSILRGAVLLVFFRILHVSNTGVIMRTFSIGFFVLFWLLIIGAHAYFFQVLRKTLSRQRMAGPEASDGGGDNANLLDDVL
jgi:hypothetical protein